MIILFIVSTFLIGSACKAETTVPETETVEETAEEEMAEKPLIGVTVFDFTNQYVTYIRNAIQYYNDDRAELVISDSQSDQNKQNDQIDTLIQRGVDALLISMVATTAAPSIIEKAEAADIPIIFWNQSPTDEDLLSYEQTYFVGFTEIDVGIAQAEMAIEAFEANPDYDKNGDGKIQYVILKGVPGHPDAELFTQGNMDTLDPNPSFELLDVQSGQWATAPAKDVMDAWIGRYGTEIEMLFSNNSGMMLGAIESLRGAGWFADDPAKQILLIGNDATPEHQPNIEDGTAYGDVIVSPVDQGRAVITMALNLLTGKNITDDLGLELDEVKAYRSPVLKITIDNLDVAVDMYKIATTE